MSTGRIRSTRPEILHDPRHAGLTDQAWRLERSLLSLADDEGRCSGEVGYLAGLVFWGASRELSEVERARDELVEHGLIEVYRVRGNVYLRLTGWHDDASPQFQRVDRARPARHPGPDEGEILNGSTKSSAKPRRRVAEQAANDRRGKGEEGKGEEGKGDSAGADHSRVIAVIDRLYLQANKTRATWGSHQRKLIKTLIQAHGADEVIRRVELLYSGRLRWPPAPWDVATIAAHFDKLVEANSAPAGRAPGPEAFTPDQYAEGSDA